MAAPSKTGDFNQDRYNEPSFPRATGGSGLTPGVESGLSSVEPINGIQPEQMSHGPNFVPGRDTGSAGSKDGKSFDFDPPSR